MGRDGESEEGRGQFLKLSGQSWVKSPPRMMPNLCHLATTIKQSTAVHSTCTPHPLSGGAVAAHYIISVTVRGVDRWHIKH